MTDTNPLTELLRGHRMALIKAASNGDMGAVQVIKLYQMHVDCPSDPGAPALCEATFKDWLRSFKPKRRRAKQ
jgi:hypothetical protein